MGWVLMAEWPSTCWSLHPAAGGARQLSPAKAAPLSDAALTPYHAIKRALPNLHADSTVVVLGVGGLGHMAVQLLRVLVPVRIVALTSTRWRSAALQRMLLTSQLDTGGA